MCCCSAICEGMPLVDCYTHLGKQLFPEIIDVVVAVGAIIHQYKQSAPSQPVGLFVLMR